MRDSIFDQQAQSIAVIFFHQYTKQIKCVNLSENTNRILLSSKTEVYSDGCLDIIFPHKE